VVGHLPGPIAAWVGRRAGDIAYVVLPGRRRRALSNLARAYPELTPGARRHLARRAWQHLGLMFVEEAALLTQPLDRFLARVRIEGLEHLEKVMAEVGRALVLTAHLGNWEILTAASRLAGYPLAVVVRPLDSPGANAMAERVRRKAGVELIDKRQALRPVLAALNSGRMVGILLDQNATRTEAAFVPFFGHPAATSRSMAVLALRTRTPVVPIFARREPGGMHCVRVQPPVPPPVDRPLPDAVVEMTARCTAVIEAAIRETPDQWLWMHHRWRTRPAGER
jgi:KDO2-lipid IV(A) lauroyltransferase